MSKFQPNPAPTLAENLAARGSRCPIPFTHDRLFETHHWWHEIAKWYHEPQPFRYALGAFIQAARSVTYMLQKEKAAFPDFGWYDVWVKKAKADPVLKWLNDARTNFVHCRSLEPHSWMKMRCIGDNGAPPRNFEDDDDDGAVFSVSPFNCTHYYMGHDFIIDHTHEFERFWAVDTLPGRELLEVCADIYDRLDDIVREAHHLLGAEMASHRRPESQRALPCMEDILKHRVIRTVLKDGNEVWEDEPPGAHAH